MLQHVDNVLPRWLERRMATGHNWAYLCSNQNVETFTSQNTIIKSVRQLYEVL